jgi:hypothetical protein
MATNTEDTDEYKETPDADVSFHPNLGEEEKKVHELARSLGVTRYHLLDYAERAAERSERDDNKFSVEEYTDLLEKRTDAEYDPEDVDEVLTASAQLSSQLGGKHHYEDEPDSIYFSYRGEI